MKKISMGKMVLLLALCLGLIAGLSLGIPAVSAIINPVPVFERNQNGQTYGTMDGIGPESPTMPDLIAVLGIKGKVGYVYVKDMDLEQPKTPDEAIEYNKRIETMAKEAIESGEEFLWTIPVYDADGKTVIDSFGIGIPEQFLVAK